MVRRKKIRTRGKVPLSRYFQELKEGQRVAIARERSVTSSFPARLQGRTGSVIGKSGKSYVIKIKDQDKEKKFLIDGIHLKKVR
jgi:large subunit ribosomal protein L21e